MSAGTVEIVASVKVIKKDYKVSGYVCFGKIITILRIKCFNCTKNSTCIHQLLLQVSSKGSLRNHYCKRMSCNSKDDLKERGVPISPKGMYTCYQTYENKLYLKYTYMS